MFQNVAIGWLVRRALDWGGWIGTIAAAVMGIYSQLSGPQQAAISQALQGNWQDITLGSLVPIVVLVFSQVWSFRATTAPQVVTADAQKIPLPRKGEEGVATTRKVETLANAAPAPKSLWDRLTGRN